MTTTRGSVTSMKGAHLSNGQSPEEITSPTPDLSARETPFVPLGSFSVLLELWGIKTDQNSMGYPDIAWRRCDREIWRRMSVTMG